MNKKYNLIKGIDDDNCRFIINVLDSYNNNVLNFNKRKEHSIINMSSLDNKENNTIIDLDKIWSKPYFYTKMRVKLTEIVHIYNKTSFEKIQKNPKKFCKKLTKIKIKRNFKKPSDCIDIVEFISNLNVTTSTNFLFVAKKLNEENLFKEEQIISAIRIKKIKDRKAQVSFIYDEICKYLNSDFVQNNYCDFINNKCVAQRHFNFYPINRKNGCCFMEVRKCNHLNKNGSCQIECMPCRLFACPYLSKKGIGYWASEFVLLRVFFTKKQRKHLVFDFYKPKESIIKKIMKLENKI